MAREIDRLGLMAMMGKISPEDHEKEVSRIQKDCKHNGGFIYIKQTDCVICNLCERAFYGNPHRLRVVK